MTTSDLLHNAMAKIKLNFPVIIALFCALFVRLFALGDMSLSNDELSSMWRCILQPTWHDMMVNGVMTDGHPPMTYFILRSWVHIFGDSVLSLRMPFILSGVIGLYFTYRIGALWFGRATGLLTITLLASISYTIYYHQIARPYAFGFLWVQAAAFFWSSYFFDKQKKGSVLSLSLWVTMAVLSCYTHYFSFMAVGLMGVTGLFFLHKANYRGYLLSGIIIVIALWPGAAIFRQQLSYDGLKWLPAPSGKWLAEYLVLVLNHSRLIYILIILLVIISTYIGWRSKLRLNKFHLIGLSWFFISFLVGYLKSVYSMPVLQASCLLFTFPFLVLVFFSFFGNGLPGNICVTNITAAILFVTCFYDTAVRQKYYTTEHHGEFKKLAEQMASWSDQYGSDLLCVINVTNKYYWDYYWVRHLHRREQVSMYDLESDEQVHILDSMLSQSHERHLAVAWSNRSTHDTLFTVIRKHYSHILESPAHFNSGIRLYAR